MSRQFPHFPKDNAICPLCETNADKPCVLLPIDGTEEGNIVQAQPTHAGCLLEGFRYNPRVGVIYRVVPSDKDAKGIGKAAKVTRYVGKCRH